MTVELLKTEEELTRADRRILEFIGSHTDEFLFMGIGQLARRLEISEATVSRFARHAGYQDFKELKSSILRQSREKGPAKKIARTLQKEENFQVRKWLEYQKECLEQTIAELDEERFRQAAEEIASAERVFIFAKNASDAMGKLLFFRLRRIGIPVVRIQGGGSEFLEGLAQVGEGDLVVFFAYSKLSRESRMILDYQKEAGYRTLAFTARTWMMKEECADVNLYACRGEEKEYHSMTAPAAVVDALVLSVSGITKEKTACSLSRLQSMKKRYQKE